MRVYFTLFEERCLIIDLLVIVLQMFIAVINENFDVAEESKKGKQASKYWAAHQAQKGSATWIRKLNPYRWVRANPVKVKVENLPANLVLPMQKSLVQDYNVPRYDDRTTVRLRLSPLIRRLIMTAEPTA